jgi:outer membrane protein OmpA-like peptidoglycan-associated protein
MATFAEVIVPLAIAVYAGYADLDRCTPKPHPDPLAENMCGTYRNALGEACTSMLSVPVPATPISLTAKRTISPIAFSTEVKNSIRATHDVCTSYWTGTIGYDEFVRQTAEKTSVLNMLYRALPPESAPLRSPFTDLAQAQGIPAQRLEAAKLEQEREFACAPGSHCGPMPPQESKGEANPPHLGDTIKTQPTPTPAKTELQLLEDRLMVAIAAHRSPALRLLTEVNFELGNAQLSDAACRDLARRTRLGSTATGPRSHIRVIGYADASGEAAFNLRLSADRASAAAVCLAQQNVVPAGQITSEGSGVMDLPADRAAQARRASVYGTVGP